VAHVTIQFNLLTCRFNRKFAYCKYSTKTQIQHKQQYKYTRTKGKNVVGKAVRKSIRAKALKSEKYVRKKSRNSAQYFLEYKVVQI